MQFKTQFSWFFFQVIKTCEQLEESGDVDRLARFLWSLSPTQAQEVRL